MDAYTLWTQRETAFPTLSKLALSLLSLAAMSSEIERVFSSASLIVTKRLNDLTDTSI